MSRRSHSPALERSPYHTTSALYPVIQRLTRSVGLAADDDAATRAEKLDRLLARYGEPVADVRPVYDELLSLDLGHASKLADLSAEQRKELTVRTLANRAVLAAEASNRAVRGRISALDSIRRPTSFCGTSFCGSMGRLFTCW